MDWKASRQRDRSPEKRFRFSVVSRLDENLSEKDKRIGGGKKKSIIAAVEISGALAVATVGR